MGRVWDSCHDQTWSASCYIGAVIYGVYGIRAEQKGVSFAPCVPEGFGDTEVKGLKFRNQEFSVKITGHGSRIHSFLLDGKEKEPFVPWDNKPHRVEIVVE